MKAFAWINWLLACSCITGLAAREIVTPRIVPDNPETAGQELAAQLRSLRPVESMTNSATLGFYERRKLLREEPLEVIINAGAAIWSTTYRLNPGASNQTELRITRNEGGTTQYRLRKIEGGSVQESTPSGAELMVPFGDSEFWLADLGMEFLNWPTQRLLMKDICRGQSCDKLESIAPAGQTSSYVRVIGWFDIDTGGPVLVEAYDAAGRMVKEFKPNDFKKVDGEWQVEEVEISNLRTRARSTIHFDLGKKQLPTVERVVLVGDSTVASASGWGDAFAKLLAPGVECLNFGRGGRSSKSYRDEGHWQKALDAQPTWVLIQFGHNDQPGKGPARETDPKTTYRENLARYVAEARANGAKPVLVTSLTRRNFNADGKIVPGQLESMADSQGEKHKDWLSEYAEATRAVAKEQNVPLIDLNARSIEQLNQLGPVAAVAFDAEAKDPSKPDKTHLSAKGAEETAKLVADEIRKNAPELARLLQP